SSRIAGRVGFLANRALPDSIDSEFAGVRYIEANPKHNSPAVSDRYAPATSGPSPLATLDLRGLPGVLKRADELVRPGSRMPHLATRLLSDTWVVDRLENALRLAAGHGRGQRFVTLSGELLDANGTLVVGTLRGDNAIISRRSELIRLREELAEIDRTIVLRKKQHESLAQSQDSLTETLTSAERSLREAIDRFNRARSERVDEDRKLQRLTDERESLARQLAGRQSDAERLATRKAEAEADRNRAKDDLASLEANLAVAQQDLE